MWVVAAIIPMDTRCYLSNRDNLSTSNNTHRIFLHTISTRWNASLLGRLKRWSNCFSARKIDDRQGVIRETIFCLSNDMFSTRDFRLICHPYTVCCREDLVSKSKFWAKSPGLGRQLKYYVIPMNLVTFVLRSVIIANVHWSYYSIVGSICQYRRTFEWNQCYDNVRIDTNSASCFTLLYAGVSINYRPVDHDLFSDVRFRHACRGQHTERTASKGNSNPQFSRSLWRSP